MIKALNLSLLVTVLLAVSASAQSFTKGDIVADRPWTRATPGGSDVGAAYVTITNNGKEAETLTGVTFDGAGKVEIHEMKMQGETMIMRQVKDGLPIKPGEAVKFAPGGYHLMLIGLKTPLTAGNTYKGTLAFAKAGNLDVEFKTEAAGASESGHHDH